MKLLTPLLPMMSHCPFNVIPCKIMRRIPPVWIPIITHKSPYPDLEFFVSFSICFAIIQSVSSSTILRTGGIFFCSTFRGMRFAEDMCVEVASSKSLISLKLNNVAIRLILQSQPTFFQSAKTAFQFQNRASMFSGFLGGMNLLCENFFRSLSTFSRCSNHMRKSHD
jgi:hypothetical protein